MGVTILSPVPSRSRVATVASRVASSGNGNSNGSGNSNNGNSYADSNGNPSDSSGNIQHLQSEVARLSQFASDLVSRDQFARRHGLSFKNRRDLYQILGYEENLTFQHHYNLWRRGGIARRIIKLYPQAIWSGVIGIFEDPDPETETPFEHQVIESFARLKAWSMFRRASILAGIGRYAIILIGADGDLNSELPTMSSPDDILYLRPYHEGRAPIKTWYDRDIDASNPFFGYPRSYEVELGNSTRSIKKEVHHSRVIHVVRDANENDIYASPVLEHSWNSIYNLEKILGAGAEATFSLADPGVQFDLDPSIQLTDAIKSDLKTKAEEYYYKMKKILGTQGVEINQLSSSIPNYSANAHVQLEVIAGEQEIPYRILIGSERGELASTQDETNFNRRAMELRTSDAIPTVNDFVDRMIAAGAYVQPSQYIIVWPDIEELDEEGKARVLSSVASANKAQRDAGDTVFMTSNEARDRILGMSTLEDATSDDSSITSDDSTDTGTNTDTVARAATAAAIIRARVTHANHDHTPQIIPEIAPAQRILIIGGPKRGKSTTARSLRDDYDIPTYCGDPKSKVGTVEENVTYLPEGLTWTEGADYVADNWISKPGPWCVEGVTVALAIRKIIREGNINYLDDVEIVYLHEPKVELKTSSVPVGKAVATVWSGIANRFATTRTIGNAISKVKIAKMKWHASSHKQRRASGGGNFSLNMFSG